MCVTPVLFAASIVLGEVLVAERQFLVYALAPLLYNGGIIIGTLLFAAEPGIYAPRRSGRSLGALAHLADPDRSGSARTPFRIRPPGVRTPAFREFVRPDAAADGQPPDRPADAHLLHERWRRRSRVGGRQRRSASPGLPGRAGQPDRRSRSRSRSSRPCPRPRLPVTGAFRRIVVRNLADDRRPHDARRRRPGRPRRLRRRFPPRGGAFGPRTTSPGPRSSSPSSPCRSRSRACPILLSPGDVRDPQHDPPGHRLDRRVRRDRPSAGAGRGAARDPGHPARGGGWAWRSRSGCSPWRSSRGCADPPRRRPSAARPSDAGRAAERERRHDRR